MLALETLPASLRDMADRLGLPAVSYLVEKLGGTTIPVPLCASAIGEARDAEIIAVRDDLAKNGVTEREIVERLARRYKLSDRQVWRILKRIPCQTANVPLFGRGVEQARLW